MKRIIFGLIALTVLITMGQATAHAQAPTATPAPATSTAAPPTSTPAAAATPAATVTPQPTIAPTLTVTPIPTATAATAAQTATPSPADETITPTPTSTPVIVIPSGPSANAPVSLFGGAVSFTPSPEIRLMLIVLVMGALGSMVHMASSFAHHVQQGSITSNWVWWYILRPVIGAALALIFYIVFRAGFISLSASPESINVFGLAAIAGMVGLSAKKATEKLKDVFDTLFRTEDDASGGSSAASGAPSIVSVEPPTLTATGSDQMVTLKGQNFASNSQAKTSGTNAPTFYVSASQLIVRIPSSALQSTQDPLLLTVTNPPNTTSDAFTLKVEGAS